MALKKNQKRKTRKIAMLFSVTGITALVLVVETYAWFVGTSIVKTSDFEINVSTGDKLALSLDGTTWEEDTLTLTKDAILGTATGTGAHNAYTGHTNSWVGEQGLVPVSTDGSIDLTANRLKMYSKTAMTATPGGYRLIATRVDNYTSDEDGLINEYNGYVAFDLFIRNGQGTDYFADYNEADDEAIYLTKASTVTAAPAGTDNPDSKGLENSVRVAFVQIGRVKWDSDVSDVTSINCTTEEAPENYTSESVKGINTGLCEDVTPTIWEPNDSAHHADLVTYFNGLCKSATTSGTPATRTYGTDACTPVQTEGSDTKSALAATSFVPTYVVKENITSTDDVDIYDGLNGITPTKLEAVDTFTDTEKNATQTDRPKFFNLAANSVTKIRVYIYLEGQDIDNYDIAALGEKIKVSFGFTKDQLDLANQESQN